MTINQATDFDQWVFSDTGLYLQYFFYFLYLNMHLVLSLNTKSPTESLL